MSDAWKLQPYQKRFLLGMDPAAGPDRTVTAVFKGRGKLCGFRGDIIIDEPAVTDAEFAAAMGVKLCETGGPES